MKRILTSALLVVWASACGGAATEDDFRSGLPSSEAVKISVPSSQGQGLTSQQSQGLSGEHSGFYGLTLGATTIVNVGVVSVLGWLKAVVEQPPTSISASVAIWGPHTQPLWRSSWRLTVEQTATHTFQYKLEGKPKQAEDSAFVTVISGTHTVALDAQGVRLKNHGDGTFTVDWDALATLPDRDENMGKAHVTYSRVSTTSNATVNVSFEQVKDWLTQLPVNAEYRYSQTPGGPGEFEFGVKKNIDVDALRSAAEDLTIKSRWTQQGAGRSDVRASGGDLSSAATLSECWDTSFLSQFLTVSYNAQLNYGQENADCAFTPASFSDL